MTTRMRLVLAALALGLGAPALAVSLDAPPPLVDDDPAEKKKDEKKKTTTVWVFETKGGAWSAGKKARAAFDVVENFDRVLTSGTRITFTMQGDAKPQREALEKACKAQKIEFVSLATEERRPATAAWVVECPGFTWASTAGKVREALMNVPGVTDAFCGTSLVLHFEGEGDLDLDAVRKVLKEKKIKTKGEITKDAGKLLS